MCSSYGPAPVNPMPTRYSPPGTSGSRAAPSPGPVPIDAEVVRPRQHAGLVDVQPVYLQRLGLIRNPGCRERPAPTAASGVTVHVNTSCESSSWTAVTQTSVVGNTWACPTSLFGSACGNAVGCRRRCRDPDDRGREHQSERRSRDEQGATQSSLHSRLRSAFYPRMPCGKTPLYDAAAAMHMPAPAAAPARPASRRSTR